MRRLGRCIVLLACSHCGDGEPRRARGESADSGSTGVGEAEPCEDGFSRVDGECVPTPCESTDCPPETCTADSCSGHGRCTEVADGVTCSCDEGFAGQRCEERGPDFYRRTLLVAGLADPDIYEEHDDAFYLVGTLSTTTVPIFESADLVAFTHKQDYDPSAVDPEHDYSYV